MRLMFWEYPENEVCYTCEDQYFYGADILVAPIYEQGSTERRVYLPKGKWIPMNNCRMAAVPEAVDGGGWLDCHAELDEFIVFIRERSNAVSYFLQ